MAKQYAIGTRVTLEGEFRDYAGELVDPTAVTPWVKDPAGDVTELTETKVGVGRYTATVDPDSAGTWYYGFKGTGDVVAADEASFTVKPTQYEAP